jgi:hypothetical protein
MGLRQAVIGEDDGRVTLSQNQGRAAAARVAQWLLLKGRADDAVALISAWAAQGANDAEGQMLLADALRINPAAPVAQLAFKRMEGMDGESAPLDEAIARFSLDELERLEAEMSRPAFRRAQVGFNNNIKYKDQVFHVQTEDSGLDRPHVITHLFADGGRIIKSHKRSYADLVRREDVATRVRALMKGQQLEMALALREGRFDEIIMGRAVGGMEVLEHPPQVDLQELATQKKQRVAASPSTAPPPAAAPAPAQMPSEAAHFRLRVLRSLTGGPTTYTPLGKEAVIGASGAINLPGEPFCHPREAMIVMRGGKVWLEDFEGGNGVFLRIRATVALSFGDEFIIGDQLLRLARNPEPSDGPGDGPTYFYASPQWVSSFRVVQVFVGGALGACVVARGTALQIGSGAADLSIAGDPLVSQRHCLVEEQAGDILLTDLASRTGVFVRIKGQQEIVHGDELLIGRTRLVLDVL